MNRKKAFTLIMLILVLVMIFSGMLLTNNYTRQVTDQKDILSDAVVVPANGTAYKKLELATSDQYYFESLTISNGTIRVRVVAPENFSTWTNTSSLLGWDILPGSGYPTMGGSNNNVDGPMGYGPLDEYMVFWNPDSPIDKEVTIRIYQETTQTIYDYTTLSVGIALIVAGSIIGIVATLKLGKRAFKSQLKMSNKMDRKKTLALVISLLLLASGAFLTFTYSKPVEAQETLAQGVLTVPATNYSSVVYNRGLSAVYYFQVNTSMSTIEAYWLSDNSPYVWVNGTPYEVHNVSGWCNFNGSSGKFGYSLSTDNINASGCLFLYNPDSFEKQVSYTIYRTWTYDNYFGLTAGIVLIAFGAIAIFIIIFKNKLQNFNKALESQE